MATSRDSELHDRLSIGERHNQVKWTLSWCFILLLTWRRFVDFAMNRVRMLKHFGVTPYIVFDGDYLPSKVMTELEREAKRTASKKLGLELHRMNKISQAHSELSKAVDVTPEMARQVIEELKRNNVQYVVAPYEADAQLVFLEKKGVIHGILSEDSDMLVFGAQRLLTKLDQYGECILFRRARFTACREVNLAGWSDKEFRTMAIMSGCDYLPSIDKMGLKTAHRLVRKYKTIEKILTMLAFDSKFRVPPNYLENFKKAEITFLHQRVFCPDLNQLIMANELKGHAHEAAKQLGSLDFIGKDVDPHVASGVARGDLHPMTKKPLGFSRREHFKPSMGSSFTISPRTPMSSSRRHSALTTSDVKSNKYITSYLQPGRTPLADISPNVRRLSPTVSDVMRYQGGEMTNILGSFGVPISRTHTTPVEGVSLSSRLPLCNSARKHPTPTSLPAARSSVLHSVPPRQQTPISNFNQAKRQRLCEEATESETSATESCNMTDRFQSRFFAPSTSNQSPSVMPKRGHRRVEREISIWPGELEDIADSKQTPLDKYQDVQGSSKKARIDASPPKQHMNTKAEHANGGLEANVTQAGQAIGPRAHLSSMQESQGKDRSTERSDVDPDSAVKLEVNDEQLTGLERENGRDMQERENNDIVAVLESPVASGNTRDLCKGSEDAMIPDSEDEEFNEDSSSQPLPKLNLDKFLFRQ